MADGATLAELVRSRRGAVSVRQLARGAGVSYTYVANIEDGRSWNLTVEALAGLASVLGVTPGRLLEAALVSRGRVKL